MPATLITVAQAKAHLLRPDLADSDPDLLQKMAAAEAAILTFVNTTPHWRAVSATWVDVDSVPADVQHAMLLLLGEFYRFRGDDVADDDAPRDEWSDMSPAIVRLLRRWRDPVLV